jgi:hypothetical protein
MVLIFVLVLWKRGYHVMKEVNRLFHQQITGSLEEGGLHISFRSQHYSGNFRGHIMYLTVRISMLSNLILACCSQLCMKGAGPR